VKVNEVIAILLEEGERRLAPSSTAGRQRRTGGRPKRPKGSRSTGVPDPAAPQA
jgi:hypothetical protein